MSDSVPYLAVIVPSYNEQDRISASLERLRDYYQSQDYTWHVTIVSDGSKDNTNDIVRAFAEQNEGFSLLDYQPNHGKGYAVRRGMLEVQGEILLFCDADLATPQEETSKLLEHMKAGSQVAIGSRPLQDSKLEKRQPLYRELLGRAFNLAVQLLAIRGIKDTQCGFKMFTQESARQIFSRCTLDGFSFDFEVLMVARDLGYRIDEVPIRWSHMEGSKVVLLRDGPRMLRDLVKLRFRRMFTRAAKPAPDSMPR